MIICVAIKCNFNAYKQRPVVFYLFKTYGHKIKIIIQPKLIKPSANELIHSLNFNTKTIKGTTSVIIKYYWVNIVFIWCSGHSEATFIKEIRK